MRTGRNGLVGVVLIAVALTGTPAAPTTVGAASSEPSHPRLLFGADDAEGLRERVKTGVPAQAWEQLQLKAEQHLAVVHPELADSQYRFPTNKMPLYLTDLAFAYVVSGDERFGRRAIDLILALEAADWPVWRGGNGQRELGNGDLSRGLALAFDWTYDLMTEAERTTIVSSLVEELPVFDRNGVHEDVLFSCLDPDWAMGRHGQNNWLAVCGGGAGLLLLAIEGEAGAPDLTPYAERAKERTLQNIAGHPYPDRTIFGSGGDGSEGVWYTFYGLKNALPFAFAWERSRGEDITTVNPGLRNVPLWLAFEQIPGQGSRFVPRNDSFETGAHFIYELGATFFALRPDGVSGWLWDQTAGPDGDDIFATPYPVTTDVHEDPGKYSDAPWAHLVGAHAPEVFTILYYRSPEELTRTNPADVSPLSRHYPERGLVNFRTGFSGGSDDIVATFEARRNAGGHRQFDLGHFSLYGYGARFALDSGYPSQDGGDAANASARGHNVVIVDNRNATQWPEASRLDFETIPYFVDSPNLTFVRSDLRSAYAWQGPGDTSLVPWADRNVLFSRTPGEPVMLAVTDNVKRSNGLHQYTWQVHTDGANTYLPTGADSFLSIAPNRATMAGMVTEASGPRLLGTLPRQGPAATTPLQTLVYSQAVLTPQRPQLDHLAVLAVTPPGADPASTATLPVDGGSALSVSWEGGKAVVASAAHGSDGVSGPVTMTGSFGKVTLDKGESMLDQGTVLAVDGRDYVTASASSSVVVSGNEVVATGPADTTYRVFAPQTIEAVTFNDQPAAFVRTGDYVSFPAVLARPTVLTYTGETSATGDEVDASAKLTDDGGTPLPGQPVTFTVDGRTTTATTDASGVAAARLSVPDHGRSQQVEVAYPGATRYGPSEDTATVTWGRAAFDP